MNANRLKDLWYQAAARVRAEPRLALDTEADSLHRFRERVCVVQLSVPGLDAIVDFAHERLAAYRLEALHLASGQSRLVDDDGDGVGDKIVEGTWDAELNLGLGLRHTPATFTGTR